MTAIGPRQRFALERLKWRVEVAPLDDDVLASLRRRGLATAVPGQSGAEWSITYAGLIAIGCDTTPDDEPPTPIEIALVDQLNAVLRANQPENRL